jgi:hypothetical protein
VSMMRTPATPLHSGHRKTKKRTKSEEQAKSEEVTA